MDETPTLRLLSEIEHKLDRLDEDVRDIKERVTSVEEAQATFTAGLIGDLSVILTSMAILPYLASDTG